MSLATNGNQDVAKFHPHEKTTKFWQKEMAAGGTSPLPPTDEEIELLLLLSTWEAHACGYQEQNRPQAAEKECARARC